MKRLNILWIGLISVLMTACYDDYEKDYDKSSVYFASQKPLRTLVADTDMSIKVGVAIGGKREVHTNDGSSYIRIRCKELVIEQMGKKTLGIGSLLSGADVDRKSTRLNSSHQPQSRMPSSA